MIVVGVDCGKNKVHMVCSDGQAYKIEMKSGTPRDESLRNMATSIRRFFKTNDIFRNDSRLYVEAPILAGRLNIQATIGIAETVGMVLSLGYPATLVSVTAWKKAVVGKGNAAKEDVELWYRSTGGQLKGQDFYDAAAICEYGVRDMDIAQRLRRGHLTATERPGQVSEHGQALAKVARDGQLSGER